MRTFKSALVLVVLALLASATGKLAFSAPRSGIWYVAPPPAGNDSNDCATPTTPCATINAALNKPGFVAGDTVRVAVGTYTGTGDQVVLLNKDATLSGGWNSAFTAQAGMSTIDGEGARNGMVASEGTASLEKFTIQNCRTMNYCTSSASVVIGTHMSITLTNSIVRDNYGVGIQNGGNAKIEDSVISNNTYCYYGGGIVNHGTLILNRTTIANNTSEAGGGGIAQLWYGGNMFINNSTISNNNSRTEGVAGGGIWIASGNSFVNNSTITGNRSRSYLALSGGGIDVDGSGTLSIQNSIVANNVNNVVYLDATAPDCHGAISSTGYNIIGNTQGCNFPATTGDLVNVDPKLGPLQDNGGLTNTHALLPGSPAINAGNPSGCMGSSGYLATDQRGYPRADRCDIGAYEAQLPFVVWKTINKPVALPGDSLIYQIILNNQETSGLNNVVITDTLPPQLAYVSNSLTATSGNYSYSNGVISWNGAVNVNVPVTITFEANIHPATPTGTTVINSAIINKNGELFARSARVDLPTRFASASKTASKAKLSPGESVQYTVRFRLSAGSDATTVFVTDTIPNYLTYINNSLTASSGNPSYNNGTILWNGLVNPDQEVTIGFDATTNPMMPGGTVVNSASINAKGEIATPTANVTVARETFLPLLVKPPKAPRSIGGWVTHNGGSANGVPLQLRFYNGSAWSTAANTTTGSNGYFLFSNLPGLDPGQMYYVRYLNPGDATRLGSWSTRALTAYSGDYVEIGRFDLANITLTSPNPGTTVGLPWTFEWNVRPATPSDSYEFNLLDLRDGDPWWWTSPLGYTGNYRLNGLPPGFFGDTEYYWAVGVHSPDGGYGVSYWYYSVRLIPPESAPRLDKAPARPRNAFSDLPNPLPVRKRP